jgi:uncharacterized repeat protein (TIGR02543 family)/LPXTG-motif cell wall-anchored protein
MSSVTLATRRISLMLVMLLTLGFVSVSSNQTLPAHATSPNSLSVYLDAPFVQGSYVAAAGGSGVTSMNFSGPDGSASCGSGAPTGISVSGACLTYTVRGHGGATTVATNATPTVGGGGSVFASTSHATNPVIINLTQESRYFGFWWSAGSDGNTVKFYKDSTLMLSTTINDIVAALGAAPANSTAWIAANNDNSPNFITAVDGSKYRKAWYFGNPRGFTSLTPSSESTMTKNEPFVYIHMFANGNFAFNRVELSGSNFEFDNMAISTVAQTPRNELFKVSETSLEAGINIVEFNSNGAGTTGTMETQVGSSATALRTNSFARTGYTFGGWATAADGSGTSYANSASYPFNASTTLYAKWNPISYTVSYDSQGGSSVSAGTYATGSAITLPAAPTRSGFTFAGWFASSTGGTALGTSYSPPGTGNITLYAQWTSASSAAPATNLAPTATTAPASLSTLAVTGSSSQTGTLVFGLAALLVSFGAVLIWFRRRLSV